MYTVIPSFYFFSFFGVTNVDTFSNQMKKFLSMLKDTALLVEFEEAIEESKVLNSFTLFFKVHKFAVYEILSLSPSLVRF